MHVVVIGMMGAGKTTLARQLAEALSWPGADLDQELVNRYQTPIAEQLLDQDRFRAHEQAVLRELLERKTPTVIATGGGAVNDPTIDRQLQEQRIIWLDRPLAQCWIAAQDRPLATDWPGFQALARKRRPRYEALAEAIITDPEIAREQLLAWLACNPPTRLLQAVSSSGSYPIFLGAPTRPSNPDHEHLFSDTTVSRLHPDLFAAHSGAEPFLITPGEASKTLATAALGWQWLQAVEAERADTLVAIGGGVVTDLGGFIASTYRRGMPLISIPTTLVGQVDAAVGGKTAIDFHGKNQVGTYHQPSSVWVDAERLATLAPIEYAAGYAEALKTALIAGGQLWESLARGESGARLSVVEGCLRAKLAVVSRDERDQGPRDALNLGHTIGHALEAASQYQLGHGQAVAIGLIGALQLSGLPTLADEVAQLLSAAGLQIRHRLDPDQVVRYIASDKKRRQGQVGWVLLDCPGHVRTGVSVDSDEVLQVICGLQQS